MTLEDHMNEPVRLLLKLDPFKRLLTALESRAALASSLTEGAASLLACALAEKTSREVLLVVPHIDTAADLHENVTLFVPKAQVSQWELQLMVVADDHLDPVGNIVEADTAVRNSIDKGILLAQKIYSRLNTKMVTSLEFPKRIGIQNGQRLFYSFLPKLPWSMGAFSEAQMRYICGHYPEDFAACCRNKMKEVEF